MQYTLLLWPHANARYQAEAQKLALVELNMMLGRLCPGASARLDEANPFSSLRMETAAPLDVRTLDALGWHSLLYALFERREDGALFPLAGRSPARLGADLPSILKYKGKTNELFLQLLMNVALYASDYWQQEGSLDFLDPMCGRATAPFIALNRGFHAVGADIDKNDLKEAEKFYKRYLEYHRYKYTLNRESRTVRGGAPVPVTRFEAEKPEAFKAGRSLCLSLACADASSLDRAYGQKCFHLITCDLPYGIQHDAQSGRARGGVEGLLRQALPGWHRILRPGGAVAVAFNAQTLRRDRVRELMAQAGFEVCSGGDYDGMTHWVEQAITRDVAVCRRNS